MGSMYVDNVKSAGESYESNGYLILPETGELMMDGMMLRDDFGLEKKGQKFVIAQVDETEQRIFSAVVYQHKELRYRPEFQLYAKRIVPQCGGMLTLNKESGVLHVWDRSIQYGGFTRETVMNLLGEKWEGFDLSFEKPE